MAIPISSSDLAELVNKAGEGIQGIQDALGRTDNDAARVRFPRGYLITIARWRKELRFVRAESTRSNLSYTLMLDDVYTWILRRTDLAGLPRDMLIKASLAALGSVAEAILSDHFRGSMGKRRKFTSRTTALVVAGAVSSEQKDDLDWLWDMRCRQHLDELRGSEFDFYREADHRRGRKTVRELILSLQGSA